MNLPIEIIVIIFSNLTIDELCNCEKVCKHWYSILLSSNSSSLYKSLDLEKRNIEISSSWIIKKITTHKTKTLNLSGTNISSSTIKKILKEKTNSIENLNLSFQIIPLENYFTMNLFSLKSIVLNDAKLKDNNLEFLLSLPNLSKLNINYNSLLTGRPFLHTEKPLESLWFEGCEHIEYHYIYAYVKKYGDALIELGIDGEYFYCNDVCSILSFAPNLKKFAIEYANEMDSNIEEYLIKEKWEYIKIRRALAIPQRTFANIFSFQQEKLVYLNLAECSYIDDQICCLIAENCRNIRSFVLTWCCDVSDVGILQIVLNCCWINFLDLTGLKDITELSFPLNEIPVYNNLRTIILEKCNKITDNHLWNLSALYPKLMIKNYYGEFKEGWTGNTNY